VPGTRSPANEYVPWVTNYERLGLIHENRCISFYAGQPYHGADWVFPLTDLCRAIDNLQDLPVASTA